MSYAASTAAASAHPAALVRALPATNKLRGNRNLGPRRGACPRCPCRSHAIYGKLCCPAGQARGQAAHGGRGCGPRTPETLTRRRPGGLPQQSPGGRLRVRDVRAIPGNNGANASADNRRRRTLLRVSRVDVSLDRYQSHLPPAPLANRPPRGAPTSGRTVLFNPFGIDPLNREPAAKPGSAAPFKPIRIDPLNREPGAFPDPGLRRGRLPSPDQYIASMIPLISANPRDASHSRRQRRRQEIFAADERR